MTWSKPFGWRWLNPPLLLLVSYTHSFWVCSPRIASEMGDQRPRALGPGQLWARSSRPPTPPPRFRGQTTRPGEVRRVRARMCLFEKNVYELVCLCVSFWICIFVVLLAENNTADQKIRRVWERPRNQIGLDELCEPTNLLCSSFNNYNRQKDRQSIYWT